MLKSIVFAMAVLAISASAANLFVNPGFETPAINPSTYTTLSSGDTFLSGWTATGGCATNCILVLDSSYTEGPLTFLPHGGNQSLDMTGSFNTLVGGMSQTVMLNPGQQYRLGFYVGNQFDGNSSYPLSSSVHVLLNGALLGTGTTSGSTPNALTWTEHVLFFTPAVAANTIEFRNATPVVDNMAGLDDVSLDVAVAPVPEPASFALVGAALAIAGLIRGRR